MVLLGPKNAVGAHYFQLFLRSAQGCLADAPLLLGLHNSGPFPAYNWIDVIRYEGAVTFGDEIVSLPKGLPRSWFDKLTMSGSGLSNAVCPSAAPNQRS